MALLGTATWESTTAFVVIKEYKDLSNSRKSSHHYSLSYLQREAKHKACVLCKLGDHPGIPLLFRVSLKEIPVSIVLKFHEDDEESYRFQSGKK